MVKFKEYKKKRFAMFNRDKNGFIVGFCNDFLRMSYRYHCVHIWRYPPNHYFNPQRGDFIICLNRKYDDVRVLPLSRDHHTFKGNYLFEQLHKGKYVNKWVMYQDNGPVQL
jgi:hypothetical protein